MLQRYFKRMSVVTVLAFLSLLCAVGTRAQETADIVGTVTDATGGVIPGASVTLTNKSTNISQTTQSGGDGNYGFALLQVGEYTVKVEAKGFQTFVASTVPLSAGDRARVDAKLEVGEQSTTVEVQAAAAALQTDTSNNSTLVPSQSVEDLPLNGRNIITLVTRTAGANEGSPGSIVAGNRPDDRRQNSQISVNGQQDTQNNNLIDGMDNNERFIGSIGVRPSVDAIQEVNVQTNRYDASVGRTGGAVIDIITKSGTNDLHGSVYEFFRNKVLNTNPNYNFTLANNPAGSTTCPTAAACPSAPNPAFRQNQYGGSIGGPIKKNKTFFFGDYEGLSYAKGFPAALFSVPTYCERGLGNSSSQFAKPCPDGGNRAGGLFGYQAGEHSRRLHNATEHSRAEPLGTAAVYSSFHSGDVLVSPWPWPFQYVSPAEYRGAERHPEQLHIVDGEHAKQQNVGREGRPTLFGQGLAVCPVHAQ